MQRFDIDRCSLLGPLEQRRCQRTSFTCYMPQDSDLKSFELAALPGLAGRNRPRQNLPSDQVRAKPGPDSADANKPWDLTQRRKDAEKTIPLAALRLGVKPISIPCRPNARTVTRLSGSR